MTEERYHEADQAETRAAVPFSPKAFRARREQMFKMADPDNRENGAMAFEARARRVFRHGPSATMVRQLLFLGDQGHDPNGWIWKTHGEWWDQEGLTRGGVDTARRRLGPDGVGVLEVKRARVHGKLHYRLDLNRLQVVMFPELDGPAAEDPVPNETLDRNFTVLDSDNVHCGVPTKYSAGFSPSHNRENARENIRDFPLQGAAAAAPPNGIDLPDDPSSDRGSSRATSRTPGSATPKQRAAGEGGWVKKLLSDLEAVGHNLDLKQKQTWGGNLKSFIKKGHGPEVLGPVVDRIVSEWGRIHLSPQRAYDDVMSRAAERKTRTPSTSPANATPQEALEALRSHELGARFIHVAEGHDFTSKAQPSGKWWMMLGGTDRERGDNAAQMGSVARRAMGAADRTAQIAAISPPAPTRITQDGLDGVPEGSSTPQAPGGGLGSLKAAVEEACADDVVVHHARAAIDRKRKGEDLDLRLVEDGIREAVDLEAHGLDPDDVGGLAFMLFGNLQKTEDVLEKV